MTETHASLSSGVSLRVLLVGPTPPPYGGMALQGRLLESRLRHDGAIVEFVSANFPLPQGMKLLARIWGVRSLARWTAMWMALWRQACEASIIHILAASWLYFFVVVYPAAVFSRLKGKRIILNYRGGEAKQFFERYGWLVKPVFLAADEIIAPSKFLGEVIGNSFGLPVRIVPNIVDLSAFRFRSRDAISPRLLVTRHLEKIYDIPSALRAFRIVQQQYPEASLWIAGTGGEGDSLRVLVAEWNLKNVRFLGHVAHEDLPSVYDQCDIMLNSSLVDNFPGSLIEASAAGLPIVSTGAGGIPFIYTNGKTAVLVEPGDWGGLARGVTKLLQSPSLAAEMAKDASAVAAACDWKQVRVALYRAYGFLPNDLSETSQRCGGGNG